MHPVDILSTKLLVPPIRTNLMPRPRILKKLDAVLNTKLTLVSAPAGYGKTTLISEWVEQVRESNQLRKAGRVNISWYSLDEGDSELTRFLLYLITTLGQIECVDEVPFQDSVRLLQASQPPPTEEALTTLINEIASCPEKCILILDDYHNTESNDIERALQFLLEHLPPQLHLVLLTRVDPQLPLARLRALGELNELRAADLRFSLGEVSAFLNEVMGLNLTPGEVAALERRTEGWIAGLQLAALSMRGKDNASEQIEAFTGSHRLVLDYLVDEVLSQQPEDVQHFLLQTSILNQFSAPLCEALTGDPASQAKLEALDRANLFIVPLDEARSWYRYHHLFSDLLRQRLHQRARQNPNEDECALHLKASQWFWENDFTEQAIKHALLGEDFDRAANQAEEAWREMHTSYRGVTWLSWVKAIPDEVIRARPRIGVGYGWSLIDCGDLEAAELHLENAERLLGLEAVEQEEPNQSPQPEPVLTSGERQALSGSIANARAYIAQARSDVAATMAYSRQAQDLLPEDDHFERSLSSILPGFAYWSNGNLEQAATAISDAITHMQHLGKIPFIISFNSYIADILVTQGRLNGARAIYTNLLDLVGADKGPKLPEIAVAHLGLCGIALEQGDREAATRHLAQAEALGELPAFPPWYRKWILAQYRLRLSEGELEAVETILARAARLYYRHPIPDIYPLEALAARAFLRNGRLPDALRWVRKRGLTTRDELSFLREFEHATLARVHIARYKSQLAKGSLTGVETLLERMGKAAAEGGRIGSEIEILVLQALAFEAQGKLERALPSLERALTLAEPESYVQTFLLEGKTMGRLLRKIKPKSARIQEYARELVAAITELGSSRLSQPRQGLVEPLSERELEVLYHLAQGLTNREIAGCLYVSVNTVKVHTRNIYGKLGVNNRTQAVTRAREMTLLPAR